MTAAWRHQPKHRKLVRDFHRQRYGNPLFPQKHPNRALRHMPSRPQRHRSSQASPSLGTVFGALIAIVVAGVAWYLIWSPAFRISDVQVQGVSSSTEQAVRAALDGYENGNALLIFPRRNVLFFSEQAAKTAIQKAIYLDSVVIQKKLPNTVIVNVKEKTTAAVFDRGGHLYALDDSGFVLRELTGGEMAMMNDLPPGMNSVQVAGLDAQVVDISGTQPSATTSGSMSVTNTNAPASPTKPVSPTAQPTPTPPPAPKTPAPTTTPNGSAPPSGQQNGQPNPPKNAWPLILDPGTSDGSAPKPVVPGTQAFTAATLGIVLQAATRMPDIAGEPVRWFVPDEASDSVDATMASGWHVYFASSTPFDVQAERLGIVLKQKVADKKADLEYVDLRYNERIFYRLKGQTQ